MNKKWIVKQNDDREAVNSLSEILNVDPIISDLLIQRGITNYDEAKTFFRPQLDQMHDPFLMKDMDKAVERLQKAIESGEKMLIYGDYDVDGTTSVAMTYSYLKQFNNNIDYYIPDRYTEGYGISTKGVDYAIENACTLVIALDCGIKANEKIDYANENGVDFIICDHHIPGDEVPNALAILDPKQEGCNYPYKELSGCGVGFKLLHAFLIKLDLQLEGLLRYIDLVAASIACDIVPITGENRIFAYYGLKLVNANPSIAFQALKDVSDMSNRQVDINDMVFRIGPRINAAGRIESGNRAVELLITTDKEIAKELASEINNLNNERKEFDKSILENALQMIEENDELINKKSTVLFNPEWHKGVIGIVASRLMEHYYRPTIMLTENDGLVSGSARSVNGFDLYAAIEKCSDLLEGYGGHMYAAGLTLKPENVPLLQERFEKIVTETITEEQLTPYLEVDKEIKLGDITPKLFRILNQFQPFGPGNMRPLFITNNVEDIGWSKAVGKNEEHLRIDIREDNNNNRYNGIAFRQANKLEIVKSNKNFDVCYVIDENHHRDRVSLQLRVKDIREANSQE